jgi:hypothetical protein
VPRPGPGRGRPGLHDRMLAPGTKEGGRAPSTQFLRSSSLRRRRSAWRVQSQR